MNETRKNISIKETHSLTYNRSKNTYYFNTNKTTSNYLKPNAENKNMIKYIKFPYLLHEWPPLEFEEYLSYDVEELFIPIVYPKNYIYGKFILLQNYSNAITQVFLHFTENILPANRKIYKPKLTSIL